MSHTHRYVLRLARAIAVLGGVVLSVLILIVCLSILGRTANGLLHAAVAHAILPGAAQALIDAGVGAVRGDFEVVEAGMAFCIFAFLPLCQVTGGHASVDIFTKPLPGRVQRVLGFLIEALFALALVVIAVQLKSGLDRNLRSGQTSLLLQYPIWWAYALSLTGAVAAAAAGVYMAAVRLVEMLTGRVIAAPDGGAET